MQPCALFAAVLAAVQLLLLSLCCRLLSTLLALPIFICASKLAPFALQLGIGAEAVAVVRLVAPRPPPQVAGQRRHAKLAAQRTAFQRGA